LLGLYLEFLEVFWRYDLQKTSKKYQIKNFAGLRANGNPGDSPLKRVCPRTFTASFEN